MSTPEGTGDLDDEHPSRPVTALSRFVNTKGAQVGELIHGLSSLEGRRMFEELAQRHLFGRDWRSAFSVYAMLYMAGHESCAWICHRLARRVENEDLFNSLFENARHEARIAKHLAVTMAREVRVLDTTRGKLGYIGIASYRHRIVLGSTAHRDPEELERDTLEVYEKVFDRSDEKNASLEALLFESVPATMLAAPKFHGAIHAGEFKSMLHEYIEGTEVFGPEAWSDIETRLLYQYWSIVPPEALVDHPLVDRGYPRMVLDRVLDRSTIDQLGQYIDKPAIEGLAGFLDRNKVSILDLLNRMPTFIFHLDLHEGNVLLDAAGEPKVIDWEQWAIAPLGFGWSSMDPEGGLPAIDMHRLRAARPLPDAIRERDLWLMAAIWGCYSALEREDHRLAATWLQRLPSLMAEEANIR